MMRATARNLKLIGSSSLCNKIAAANDPAKASDMISSRCAKTFFDTPPAPLSDAHAIAAGGVFAQESHNIPSVRGQMCKREGIQGCVLTFDSSILHDAQH
jgi:hypothetical protein